MSSTDFLGLNASPMFEKIRAGRLPIDGSKTQDLLEVKDDLLFAWDSKDCCLLVTNWRAAQLQGFDKIKYQTLRPSHNQNFQVEKILCSNDVSLIALVGSHGLAILELPRRWGPNGQFMEGKESIICRSTNLDEELFANNSHLQVFQVRWHPSSPTDSHLLALLSDNTIRVYDDSSLRHVWRVGPLPCGPTTPSSKGGPQLAFLYGLGETAVDFDIAPPRVVSPPSNDTNVTNTSVCLQNRNKTVEWPIVVLRGNGNIYVLCAGIDTDKPRLEGPLTYQPQTDDNYGTDSCSILVIPSLPPTLVIAESNGKLHHALLMESESTEEIHDEIDSSLVIYPSEWTVNVLETVELELGLPDAKAIKSHNCPIHLQRDYINELRYFAYHNTGLHVVTLNFIKELQRFTEAKDTPSTSGLPSLSQPSRAEYILCTKIEGGNKINAVLGFALHQLPSGVVLLLSSGQVISLQLIADINLLADLFIAPKLASKNENPSQTPIARIMGEPFITHIQNILARSVTQPILSLDKSVQPSPQECYELLTQAIEVLRTQYVKKHDEVRLEMMQRVGLQQKVKEQQRKEIEELEKEREIVRENAYRLAERFEEISEKQQILSKKCQDLVRDANACLPDDSIAHNEFAASIEQINKTTKSMAQTLSKAKENVNKQSYHINKYTETSNKTKFELPPKQESTIKDILMQISSEIDSQIKEIRKLNSLVN